MNSAEDLKDLTYDPPDFPADFPASELNFCVRCGSCKELCPTYTEDVTEGMSARGRVMLLKKFFEGEMEPSETLDKRVFSCMLCGACNGSCPLGINITDAIYEGRKNLRQFSNKRRFLSLCMSFALKKASTGFRILKFIEGIGEILPVHRLQPFKVLKEMGIDSLDSTLRDGMSLFKVSRPKGRIAVFAGCTVNFLYPHIGRSLIHSLNTMNYDVILPKGEACCGAPLLGLGLKEDAAELAYRNMATFKKMNVEAVIGLCPTCVHFVRNEYKRLIGDAIENAVEASQFFS
ncbi:MAG: (Fe-S)-binding protein, partial [Nitrospirae bacterium]|nr:(Fe-S)-binding protein [Nitrospirota bacterium]